jgi:tetratricopeptide (TPR) repeat protein
VDEYGLDKDFPPDFQSESLKIGMSPELAQNYWRSHWELPSVGQAFEMFHRKVIDEAELQRLMRAQDIMPYWRDRLIKISYNPITRVDVRRLYRLGVIDDNELKNRYEAIGYSPNDASLMTEFTKRFETGEDKGITRESAIKAYREQIITREELIKYLKMLDYSDEVIEYWLKIVDYDEANELNKLKIDELVALYRKGKYTFTEFEQFIRSAGLPPGDMEKALLTERVSTAKAIKIPGEEVVWRWYTLAIISDEEFVTRYKRLGYNDEDITNFLTEHELTGGTHKVKYLPLETYKAWYVQGFINVEVAKSRLLGMGLKNADVSQLIELWNREKNKTANI